MFQIDDFVGRISYDKDIVFRVVKIVDEDIVLLRGEDVRLIADAPVADLVTVEKEKGNPVFQKMPPASSFQLPGKVLHVDGDLEYLQKSLSLYQEVGVPVWGVFCREIDMPLQIGGLLATYPANILVLTGHDAFVKSNGTYRNSAFLLMPFKLHE